MALRWKIPFKALNGTSYTVNIYDSNYSGSATTLQGAANPFETKEDDSDDIFTPIRTQSGYLRIIDNGTVLRQMAVSSPLQRQVTLTSGNNTLWKGYLSCEEFSQEFDGIQHMVELPITSGLAVLDGVMLPQGVIGLRTIGSYINEILLTVGYDYHDAVWPQSFNTSCLSYAVDSLNWLQRRDRPDEVGNLYNPSSMKDVLADICTFFGMCCSEYNGVIYFTMSDIDSGVSKSITFAGADHQEVILPGKHKITVSGAVNKYTDTLWSLSMDDLVPNDPEWEDARIYSYVYKNNDYNKAFHDGVAGSGHFFHYVAVGSAGYQVGGAFETVFINAYKDANNVAYCGEDTEKVDFISMHKNNTGVDVKAFEFTSKEPVTLINGTDMIIGLSGNLETQDPDHKKVDFQRCHLWCYLRIGSYYFDGNSWTTTRSKLKLWFKDDGSLFANKQYSDEVLIVPINDFYGYNEFKGYRITLPGTANVSGIMKLEILAPLDSEHAANRHYFVLSNMSARVYRKKPLSEMGGDFSDSTNEYTKILDNGFLDEYTINSKLTTAVSYQWGKGVVINSSGNAPIGNVDITYGSANIAEKKLLARASSYYANSRVKIVVTAEIKDISPANTVTINGTIYNVIAISRNYWNSTMQLTLVSA